MIWSTSHCIPLTISWEWSHRNLILNKIHFMIWRCWPQFGGFSILDWLWTWERPLIHVNTHSMSLIMVKLISMHMTTLLVLSMSTAWQQITWMGALHPHLHWSQKRGPPQVSTMAHVCRWRRDPTFMFTATAATSLWADHCWEGAAWERVQIGRRKPSIWPLDSVRRWNWTSWGAACCISLIPIGIYLSVIVPVIIWLFWHRWVLRAHFIPKRMQIQESWHKVILKSVIESGRI